MEYGFAVITEAQRRELLRYLEDRRGGYMTKLVCFGVGALFFSVLSIPVFLGVVKPSALTYTPRGSLHRVELSYVAVILIVVFICLAVGGIGRYYGPTSPISCVRRCNYQCGRIIVAGKSPDRGKHPYSITASDGNTYCCPVYLDYKNVRSGSTMVGVVTGYGKCFAMADTEAMPPEDSSVQRRLPPGL
ncbi:MAG: hypothetical protein II723_05845 [Oscillospiraceae bacterium]|jgi:hypothetical protein|nr:hypothetical protein [Oscillospiraceae bacterium]